MAVIKKPDGVASTAGAAGGTGLLGLAALIPDHYAVAKNIFLYAAPSATVLISVLWTHIRLRIRRKVSRSDLEIALADERKICGDIHSNPLSSEEHKKAAQLQVEKLEQLVMEIIRDQTTSIIAELKEVT